MDFPNRVGKGELQYEIIVHKAHLIQHHLFYFPRFFSSDVKIISSRKQMFFCQSERISCFNLILKKKNKDQHFTTSLLCLSPLSLQTFKENIHWQKTMHFSPIE